MKTDQFFARRMFRAKWPVTENPFEFESLTTEQCPTCVYFCRPAGCEHGIAMYLAYKEHLLGKLVQNGWNVESESVDPISFQFVHSADSSKQFNMDITATGKFILGAPDFHFYWNIGSERPFYRFDEHGKILYFRTFAMWEAALLKHFQLN